jgi:hypothetical protein
VTRVSVQIDELVLHGVDPRRRVAIGLAVERELSRLLRSPRAIPPVGAAVPRLDGGTFEVPHDAPPSVLGTHIARAIHGSLSTTEAPR